MAFILNEGTKFWKTDHVSGEFCDHQWLKLDFPTFCGHANLALIVALGIYDGHEIQFGKNTASHAAFVAIALRASFTFRQFSGSTLPIKRPQPMIR
jgi:hypothetical protein